uniref:Uncharacterized protein n=1 Tax=Helicotheca tamesis TaxID=374047 RepID=A0A7S2GZR6_9STRA|mmetsp:Transcript_13806/g.18895  ORF Transcript_13806/g.18895 Transcript_13806/m.18895 type:complete len:111 (+) Transcript_13806:2-334(+)
MDNECRCARNVDCDSGRCEGYLPNLVCEARLANGASCNENSDCSSDYCSWSFKCDDAPVAGPATGTDGGSSMTTAIIIISIVGVFGIGLAAYFAWSKKAQYTEVPTDVVV